MTLAPPEQGMLPSPCVGICRLDNATGWCLGCARDTKELASWRTLSPAEQTDIWADLPRRKAILGLSFRLLPWSGEVLLAALVDLARQPNTGWSIGVYGAVAEFVTRSATIPEIEIGDDRLILRTTGGALRLCPPPACSSWSARRERSNGACWHSTVRDCRQCRQGALPSWAVTRTRSDRRIEPGGCSTSE